MNQDPASRNRKRLAAAVIAGSLFVVGFSLLFALNRPAPLDLAAYSSSQVSFSIDAPEGWVAEETALQKSFESLVFVPSDVPEGDLSSISIVRTEVPFDERESLNDFYDRTFAIAENIDSPERQEQFKNEVKNLKYEEQFVGDYRALRVAYSLKTSNGSDYNVRQYFVYETEQVSYTVNLTASPEFQGLTDAEYDIVESLRFVEN